MKLPNSHKAVVDIIKIRDYCLSNTHPRGKYKARVFNAALGLTGKDAEQLREALLKAAYDNDAVATVKDDYGQRYVLEFSMDGPSGVANIRSSWIVRTGEDFPRLTSCYIL